MYKQLKISKLFKKKDGDIPQDCEDLEAEIQQLERNLKQVQTLRFEIQRNSLKRKLCLTKKKDEKFMRPQKIILTSSVEHLKRDLDLYMMLTGMEVKSYVKDEHCCVVYQMQHQTSHIVQNGLRINLQNGDNVVSKYSLPLGFNLSEVMEDYDTIMTPECLRAVRKALVAYYDRIEQFDNLKKLSSQIQLFKIMDGSHIEVTFTANSVHNPDEEIDIVLILDYRVYDIRPKHFDLREIDLSPQTVSALKTQCNVFKKDSLVEAFRKCFMQGKGPYLLMNEVREIPEDLQKRHVQRTAKSDSDEDYDPSNRT